ncbi:MAG: integration host factor subunit beta [Nitrospirae bacterium]|nr:integration host factor subunit beta [Candidatus Troglogloeales bacterium]MBI3598999.1 integration host factor subunit beta [Candidatus Troglogloeales bacterium]
MTRSDLIKKISEQTMILTEDQVTIVVMAIIEIIKEALGNGDKVEIRGFGSFRLRTRKSRKGRNPRTGATVSVPEKQVPFFKTGKELRELVNH